MLALKTYIGPLPCVTVNKMYWAHPLRSFLLDNGMMVLGISDPYILGYKPYHLFCILGPCSIICDAIFEDIQWAELVLIILRPYLCYRVLHWIFINHVYWRSSKLANFRNETEGKKLWWDRWLKYVEISSRGSKGWMP